MQTRFRPNFSTCPLRLNALRHHIQCHGKLKYKFETVELFLFGDVLVCRGVRMILQPDWRVAFSISIRLIMCALSTVQAANSQDRDDLPKTQKGEEVQITAPTSHRDESSDSASATLPVKYWGNSFSLKFHRPSCPFAKAMSAHHVMFFNFRRQAIDSGQVPCRYCLPPNWTTVRASLWHPAELPKKEFSMPEPTTESVDVPAIPPQLPR